jgi:probable HAF family extracellular repeat protein
MHRVGAVLAVVLSVFVCGTATSPVGALPGAPSVDGHGRPITVVDVGGWGSGLVQLGLSERGHVVVDEQVPPDGSTPSRFRTIRWYQGRTVEIAAEPGRQLDPSGMNDRGVVVGIDRPLDGGPSRGFVWNGRMIPQPEEPSEWWAETIDDRGRILVNRREGTGSRASVRSYGREITSPDVPGSGWMSGRAMNDRGQVLGVGAGDGSGGTPTFVWRPGTQPVAIVEPDGSSWFPSQINDRGSVLFSAFTPAGSQVVLWKHGRAVELGTLGGSSTLLNPLPFLRPDQLNDRDQVTGTSETASGQRHAFLWSNGRMRDLGTLGGANSYGYGINDRGEVVGVSDTATGTQSAFLWRDGRMIDIGALASPTRSAAHVINDRGQVLGQRDDFYAVVWETRGRG